MRLARWLRRLAAAAMLFLALAVAYEALRWAGFRFRWETDPVTTAERPSSPSAETSQAGERASRRAAAPVPTRAGRGIDAEAVVDGRGPAIDAARAGASGADPLPAPPAGGGDPIEFETFPDGSAVCAPCPVSDEYAPFGVRFSFRSWSASSPLPFLVDAGEYLPEGNRSPLRVGPALADAGSMEVGVIRLELSSRPSRVTFDLVGPSLIERFEVTAWSAGRRIESVDIPRFEARTYHAAGGGRFRSEAVLIESAAGIERIELDGWGPPGHLLLIDHLVIGGGRDGRP